MDRWMVRARGTEEGPTIEKVILRDMDCVVVFCVNEETWMSMPQMDWGRPDCRHWRPPLDVVIRVPLLDKSIIVECISKYTCGQYCGFESHFARISSTLLCRTGNILANPWRIPGITISPCVTGFLPIFRNKAPFITNKSCQKWIP